MTEKSKSIPVRFTLTSDDAGILAAALSEMPGVTNIKVGSETNISQLRLDIHDASFVTAIIEVGLFTTKLTIELCKMFKTKKAHKIDVRLVSGASFQLTSSEHVTEEKIKAALNELLK